MHSDRIKLTKYQSINMPASDNIRNINAIGSAVSVQTILRLTIVDLPIPYLSPSKSNARSNVLMNMFLP